MKISSSLWLRKKKYKGHSFGVKVSKFCFKQSEKKYIYSVVSVTSRNLSLSFSLGNSMLKKRSGDKKVEKQKSLPSKKLAAKTGSSKRSLS